MTVYRSPRFERSLFRLSEKSQEKAERCENIFRANPFDRRLKSHKLHGKMQGLWSFSVDRRYRILFEFDGDDVIFLDIGDHDLYK